MFALSILLLAGLSVVPEGLACDGAGCLIPKAELRVLGAVDAGYLLSLTVPSCEAETDFVRRIIQKDWAALIRGGDLASLAK